LLATAVAGVEVPRAHTRGGGGGSGAGGTSKVTAAAGIGSYGVVFSVDATMDLPIVAAWPMRTGWGTNGKERRRKENKK
jgi:hypothetical protein